MIAYQVMSNKNCNLSCYFCFAIANVSDDNTILSAYDFHTGLVGAINECRRKHDLVLLVKIYGGEPMLYHKHVENYLHLINNEAEDNTDIVFLVTVITNGTKLPDSTLSKINELSPTKNLKFNMAFSLEGSRAIHDKVRCYPKGESTFNTVIENMIKYKKVTHKYPKIETVLTPELLDDIQSYIDFMESNKGLGVFEINPMFDDTDVILNESQISNMKTLFDYYIDRFKKDDYNHISLYQQFRTQNNRCSENPMGHCKAGCGKMNILPSGELVSCFKFDVHNVQIKPYGHVCEKNTFENVIVKEKFFKNIKTPYYDICDKCQRDNDFGCLGKCLAVALEGKNIEVGSDNIMCKYHIKFGHETNRLFDEVHETVGFKKKLETYTKFRKLPESVSYIWGY